MKLGSIVGCLVLGLAISGCEQDNQTVPKPDLENTTVQLNLPEIPTLDVPQEGVQRLRLIGSKYFSQRVEVRGYVTYIYDCVRDGGKKKWDESMSAAEIRRKIKKDASLCYKPHFYIGDEPETPHGKSLWITDLDVEFSIEENPDAPTFTTEGKPKFDKRELKKGDKVFVEGIFTQRSVTGFQNSFGLIKFRKVVVENDEA